MPLLNMKPATVSLSSATVINSNGWDPASPQHCPPEGHCYEARVYNYS